MKRPTSQSDKTSAITTSKSKSAGEIGIEKSSTATTTKPAARATAITTTDASSKQGTKQDMKAKPVLPQDKPADASTLTASEDRESVEEIPGNAEKSKQKSATGDAKKTTEEKKEEKLEPVGKELPVL